MDDSYFPEDIGKQLFPLKLNQDIFPILENEINTSLAYADLKIESTAATEEIATQLKIETTSPVLKIIRMVFSDADRLVDYEHLYYRGDAFQYQLRVNRS